MHGDDGTVAPTYAAAEPDLAGDGALTGPVASMSPRASVSAAGTPRSGGRGSFGGLSRSGSGVGLTARGGGLRPSTSFGGLVRSQRQDMHDLSVAPLLESLTRCSADAPELLHPPQLLTADATLAGGFASVTASPRAATAIGVSRSVDLGSLPSVGGTGRFGVGSLYASHVLESAAERSSRISRLKHPDTRHVTAVDDASASFAPPHYTFTRKSAAPPGRSLDFFDWQADDRARRSRAHDAARARTEERLSMEATYRAQDTAADAHAEAKAQHQLQTKQQYAERAHLYDAARSYVDAPTSSLFGRIQMFEEHLTPAHRAVLR